VLYKSSGYVIDAKALTVTTSEGNRLDIRPKTCQFLLVLLTKAGSPVHKQTLLDEVWPDSVVEEQAVFQSVNELRQLFSGKEVIKTIPKKGYVWLPGVEEVTPQHNANASSPWSDKHLIAFASSALLICLLFALLFFYTSDPNEGNIVNQQSSTELMAESEIAGSVVVLPTTNLISGNDHSWVRLGVMDQLIQRLPSNAHHGVLQTDYVLEVLERANAPLSNIKGDHVSQIFKVSGADLIVATKLAGTPHDYQLSYTLYRPKFKQQGVLFGGNTQDLVDELSQLLANVLGSEKPLSAAQYHADFNHQMLGVAIDFRLEQNHKAAIPLLRSIIAKDPENFTAQRLLIESLLALRKPKQASEQLSTILPIAHKKADKGELVRLMYFKAISLANAGDLDAASLTIESALQIAKENYDWLYQAYLTNFMARIAIEHKEYAHAETLFYEAMQYHQVLKCPVGETVSWINLAMLAKRQSQPEEQAQAFDNAMAIAKRRELTNLITRIRELTE